MHMYVCMECIHLKIVLLCVYLSIFSICPQSTTNSHSVVANMQKAVSLMKVHSHALCGAIASSALQREAAQKSKDTIEHLILLIHWKNSSVCWVTLRGNLLSWHGEYEWINGEVVMYGVIRL